MVDFGEFGGVAGDILGSVSGGAVYLLIGLVVCGALFGIIYYFVFYRKKFDIDVKILSERAGGQFSINYDKAAILQEKGTHLRYFRLWTYKLDFPIPKFEILQRTTKGDLLEMYQKGDDEFYFLTPSKINKKWLQKIDGTIVPFASQTQKLMDTDTAYWNVKRKRINKGIFEHDSLLMKLLPYFPILIISMMFVFMIYMLSKGLPEMIREMKGLIQELNKITTPAVIEGLVPLCLMPWKKYVSFANKK